MKSENKKQKRSFILTLVFSFALLLTFTFIYYAAYQTYLKSEQKVTASHFSDMATGGRALVRSYIERLTDGARDSGNMLAYLTPDSTALSYYFL